MSFRFATLVAGATLGAAALGGVAFAQEQPVPNTNADGSYVVASDDGTSTASGEGQGVVYGDINTGGGGGEILGDPAAVANLNTNPGTLPIRSGTGWVLPVSDGDLVPEVDQRQPAPAGTGSAPGDGTTTTDIQSQDGTASASGSETGAVPVDDSTGVPVDGSVAPAPASSASACTSYPTWYDAQVAYEAAGLTAADPALVGALDPDYDGIACEEYMQ